MKENIITIYNDDNSINNYKVLLIIEKDYYYIIYTDINNHNLTHNLYAIKTKSLDSKEVIPISDLEWKMIEKEFKKLINSQ